MRLFEWNTKHLGMTYLERGGGTVPYYITSVLWLKRKRHWKNIWRTIHCRPIFPTPGRWALSGDQEVDRSIQSHRREIVILNLGRGAIANAMCSQARTRQLSSRSRWYDYLFVVGISNNPRLHYPICLQRLICGCIGECKEVMTSYLACMKKVKGMNDPECRNLAKSYLTCRMDKWVTDGPLWKCYISH